MAMLLNGNSRQRAEINMTPLIDVLLVLLIIFMVITPLTPRGLTALVPQPARPDADDQTSQAVVITVEADRTIRLNQEIVPLEQLHGRLAGLFKHAVDHVVFVRGYRGIEYQHVAQVIDIAKGAGLRRVALMTD